MIEKKRPRRRKPRLSKSRPANQIRNFDSRTPNIPKSRGALAKALEKYVSLAQDAFSNGDRIVAVDAATNVGAQGATINYARGTGVRDRMGLLGVTIDEQKEVVRIIVSKEQSNRVFESMFLAGSLDTPGKGIMWMVKLDRVATHIPKDVLKKVGGAK